MWLPLSKQCSHSLSARNYLYKEFARRATSYSESDYNFPTISFSRAFSTAFGKRMCVCIPNGYYMHIKFTLDITVVARNENFSAQIKWPGKNGVLDAMFAYWQTYESSVTSTGSNDLFGIWRLLAFNYVCNFNFSTFVFQHNGDHDQNL